MSGPWTFDQSEARLRRAAMGQRAAERALRKAGREKAETERSYREALALQIVQEIADGAAKTVAADLARGRPHVAALRELRDIAEAVYEAQQQVTWRRSADRRDVRSLAEWSMRRELAEGYGDTPEPEFAQPIGAAA